MQTFGSIFTGNNNYFTAIRLFAALAVVFSHSWLIQLGEKFEPLYAQTGFTLGQHAVTVFFAISGFLVCSSIDRQPNLFAFGLARFTRIFPAFIVCGVAMAVFGYNITTVNKTYYLNQISNIGYFSEIFIYFNGETKLPGVFNRSLYENSVLATIWTLKYEIICYIGLAMASVFGILKNKYIHIIAVLFLFSACCYMNINNTNSLEISTIHHFIRFMTSFYCGMIFYIYKDKIPHTIFIPFALVLLTYLLSSTPLYNFMLYLAVGYTSLYLALIPNNLPLPEVDISYGVYLYGWPIQQTIYMFDGKISSWNLSIYASLIAMLFGVISWFLIEKPSLTLARNYIKTHFNPASKAR